MEDTRAVVVLPYDLAAIGDAPGKGPGSAGDIDRGEATVGVEKAMKSAHPLPRSACRR
jgi:hypothetical protein